MDFDKLVRKRKSVHSFKSKKVSWKLVLEAIDSALQGPFANNQNNLHFLVVENEKKIAEIAKFCEQHWINGAGTLIVVCSDDTHLENQHGEKGRVYSRQQAGAAIQTILLKLTDLGLSSCWVGAYTDELIKEKLRIPQHIQIEAIIPVGYEERKKGDEKPAKKELVNVLFWEDWDETRRPTAFEDYPKDYSPVD